MHPTDLSAALATVSVPWRCARPNGPPLTLNGVRVQAGNLADALSWALIIVRHARNADWTGRAYAAGWIRSNEPTLRAVHADFAAGLLLATSAPTCTGGDAGATPEELELLDLALCDAIERVDQARGCGWYDKAGRLNHRPPVFEAAA